MKGMTKMTNFLPVVAEASASGGNQSSSMIFMILFYVAIFAALYFFLIRPNSKKKKEEAQLRNSLEIGDEITTIGGIMGRVVAIKDDEDAIIIETGSDRVKMKFKKWCISTVDTVKEQPQQAGQPEKKGFFFFLLVKKILFKSLCIFKLFIACNIYNIFRHIIRIHKFHYFTGINISNNSAIFLKASIQYTLQNNTSFFNSC